MQHAVESIKLLTVISTPANQVALLAQVNVTEAAARFIIKGEFSYRKLFSYDTVHIFIGSPPH